jgi:hypothetical protein
MINPIIHVVIRNGFTSSSVRILGTIDFRALKARDPSGRP